MADHPLDNHLWNALNAEFSRYSRGVPRVRLLAPDIGPAAAIAENTPTTLAALAAALDPGTEIYVIYPEAVEETPELELVHRKPLLQMVAEWAPPATPDTAARELVPTDFEQMQVLVDITRPGPLGPRAMEIGGFHGIFAGERLVALAGERLRFAGFTEVATVCTHPDHRGRDYAKAVVSAVMRGIFDRGETPFLGVDEDNVPAIRLYERLGFTVRSRFQLNIMRRR